MGISWKRKVQLNFEGQGAPSLSRSSRQGGDFDSPMKNRAVQPIPSLKLPLVRRAKLANPGLSLASNIKLSLARASILACLAATLTGCNKHEQTSALDSPRLTPNTTMVDVTFHSQSLERDMPYRVILPRGAVTSGKISYDPWLILANGEKGSINAHTTREHLVRTDGASNVTDRDVDLELGEVRLETVLFARDPERRIEIRWKDPSLKTKPASATIRGKASR